MPLVPSPEFGWSVNPVFSNKRKLSEDDSVDMESCDMSAASKRHCHSQMIPESHHMNQVEINHNSGFPNLNNNNNNNNISPEDIHGCMKDIATVHQSQNLLTNTPESQPSSQNDMIMDLCDETYSNTTLETDAEIESMDNDYVPDSSQYRQPHHQHNEHLQQPNTNNFGGESSPEPNRIRSYCKPTLDYMMDLRPYISDYY